MSIGELIFTLVFVTLLATTTALLFFVRSALRLSETRIAGFGLRGTDGPLLALRISVGMCVEDWGCWRADLAPVDAAGVEQDPEPVVGEAGEAVAGALDALLCCIGSSESE